jgi:hypothetical protein
MADVVLIKDFYIFVLDMLLCEFMQNFAFVITDANHTRETRGIALLEARLLRLMYPAPLFFFHHIFVPTKRF